jgi:hypothetical protein
MSYLRITQKRALSPGYGRVFDAGSGLSQVPPAPDSPVANVFVEAHRTRWCTPGQANSDTCRALVAPRLIRRVVIHNISSAPRNDCVRFDRINDVVRGWQNPGRQASAHYLVDRDGTITQMVREANVAFHIIGHNTRSIGIEHADICNKPDAYTTPLYERSASLVRDIAARNGFAISVFGVDTNNPNAATVFGHSSLGHHGDPGPYWDWEYYAALLRWDGRTAGSRPTRLVVTTTGAIPPAGWRVRRRVQVRGEGRACIPNTHCADRRHSYGDNYWRARPNPAGRPAEFRVTVNEPGLYKVSLWWPNVQGANPEARVQVEVRKAGGPAMANVVVDQRRGYGRWNDLGSPFTFTVPATGAQVTVRVLRASRRNGWIVADAIRVLRVQ